MAHDFANRHQTTRMNGGLPGWVWFLTGLIAGIFVSFLFYLSRDVPADPEAEAIIANPNAALAPKVEEMEWDFYDIFPKTEVPIVEEYGAGGDKVRVPEKTAYLLQAGSFQNGEDADRLRAELILLGLDVFVREVNKDGISWHRVLVGPIDTEVEMTRQRRTLAEADVATIALKVSP